MNRDNKRVVIVTGGSRGVGKGTALALSNSSTITYITGRSRFEGQTTQLPGTLDSTAAEINNLGGHCEIVECDHSRDDQIKQLIERVIDEQGKVDILVNNVYQVPDDLLEWKPFWERPIDEHWDSMIKVGMRSHYVSSVYTAPHMVEARSGMIVNISSPAARAYIHSVIYGIGKAGTDKMVQDMSKELAEYQVAAFGLWPGIVKTERLLPAIEADALPPEYEPLKSGMESAQLSGRIIDAIDSQKTAMNYSGRSWWNSALCKDMDVRDIDGTQPDSYAAFMGEPIEPAEAMIK